VTFTFRAKQQRNTAQSFPPPFEILYIHELRCEIVGKIGGRGGRTAVEEKGKNCSYVKQNIYKISITKAHSSEMIP
jgi:hypothetical protein